MPKIKNFLKKNTIVPILVVFFVLASVLVNGFFSIGNILNIINQNAIKGIMAIGMTFVIINGYFDMSVCTVISLTAALVAGIQNSIGLLPAVLIAVAAGLLVGAINGLLVARVGINAFVATLAMMLGARGASYIYSGEQSILASSEIFTKFGSGRVFGVSYISILFFVMLLIGHYVLKYTKHGRNTYAVGGNPTSAYNAGINCERTTFINFVICGFTGGLGGILFAAQTGAASPPLGWPDMHMLVIAGVVLGGSKLTGGFGNLWYTFGGIMILGIINNVMNLLNVQTYISTLITGLVMIAVLYMDKVITEREEKERVQMAIGVEPQES